MVHKESITPEVLSIVLHAHRVLKPVEALLPSRVLPSIKQQCCMHVLVTSDEIDVVHHLMMRLFVIERPQLLPNVLSRLIVGSRHVKHLEDEARHGDLLPRWQLGIDEAGVAIGDFLSRDPSEP